MPYYSPIERMQQADRKLVKSKLCTTAYLLVTLYELIFNSFFNSLLFREPLSLNFSAFEFESLIRRQTAEFLGSIGSGTSCLEVVLFKDKIQTAILSASAA